MMKSCQTIVTLKGIVHLEEIFEMTKNNLTNYADNVSDIHFSLKFLNLLKLEETHILVDDVIKTNNSCTWRS